VEGEAVQAPQREVSSASFWRWGGSAQATGSGCGQHDHSVPPGARCCLSAFLVAAACL